MSRRLLVYQLVLKYISVNRERLLAYQIVLRYSVLMLRLFIKDLYKR